MPLQIASAGRCSRLPARLPRKANTTRWIPPTARIGTPDEDENTVIVAMARMGYQRSEIERVQQAIGSKVDAKAPIAERLQAALKILHGGD